MTTNDLLYIIIALLLVVSYCAVFALGVFIGKLNTSNGVNNGGSALFISEKAKEATKKLSIDDRKVVIGLGTEGLDKKYDKLGDIQHTNDDISSSINKLKNMKG